MRSNRCRSAVCSAVAATLFIVVGVCSPAEATSVIPASTSDAELLLYAYNWGSGFLDSSSDGDTDHTNNSGVTFVVDHISNSGTGLSDNYPVSSNAGGTGAHNGDFTAYDSYSMVVTNLMSDASLDFVLYMNTGFTGTSGTPSNDSTNDTYWQGSWIEIGSGESATLTLDFDSATPNNIEDNKDPHTHGTNWVATSINDFDRGQVTNIGLQVADFDLGSGVYRDDATFRVSAIPEPVGMVMLGALGAGMLVARRWRRS